MQRIAIVFGLLAIVFSVFWVERGGLSDEYDRHISFLDVVYFTMVTVTSVGYGDVVPVSDSARLVTAIFVTPIRLVVLLVLVGTAYQLVIQRAWENWRMKRMKAELSDHIVICGFGSTGQHAASELIARSAGPGGIVIIDPSEAALHEAARLDLIGLRGQASDVDVLDDAAISCARAAIVCTGRDDTNTQVCLALRSLSHRLRIVAAVRERKHVPLLRQSGADVVISPSGLGGQLMADAIESPAAAETILDALTARGDALIAERFAASNEAGKRARDVETEVVIAIRRNDDTLWPWDRGGDLIAEGDRLIILRKSDHKA